MISFSLICTKKHPFDGWFGSSTDFEDQCERGLVSCPVCGSTDISKTLMTPQVSTGRAKDKVKLATLNAARQEAIGELKKMRDKVLDGAEDVGKDFADEARKIHYGESEKENIYGEATRDEVEGLVDEGVPIAPIPVLPDDVN